MSSSTSSSEAAEGRWRAFALTFVAAAAALAVATLAFLAALDPYDTGRFALATGRGVAVQGPRTADASRGRDPRFDAAIVGNSHIELIRPETLKTETGLDFVSLTVPATNPKEQFVLIDWFLRHHSDPAALVIGLDASWCHTTLDNEKAFPFWLYDRSALAYLSGLMRYSALEHIPGRIGVLMGWEPPARPDGYWNYEGDYRKLDQAALRAQLELPRPVASYNPANAFPAVDRLRAVLAGLPPATRVVLAWPPVHVSAVPAPGSPAEATTQACHTAYAAVAAERPRTSVLDWTLDRPENRVAANFFDQTHYRPDLAEVFQRDLAAAINDAR